MLLVKRFSPTWMFPLAAAISGFASGCSVVMPGGGIVLPGVFFGMAIAYAVHSTIEKLTPLMTGILISVSTCGFWIAGVTLILSYRMFGNSIASNVIESVIAGGAGASIIALGMAICSESFQAARFVAALAAVGGAGGALSTLFVKLHDYGHLPHPVDFIFDFMSWQIMVAAVVPYARRKIVLRHPENS